MLTTRLTQDIIDADQPIWIAKIKKLDGSEEIDVYQDDCVPHLLDHFQEKAWQRLGKFCAIHDYKIVSLKLKFRSHVEHIFDDEDVEGAFFREAIFGAFGKTDYKSRMNIRYYLTGYLKDGILKVQKWRVPELIFISEETRDPNDEKRVGKSLILHEQTANQ